MLKSKRRKKRTVYKFPTRTLTKSFGLASGKTRRKAFRQTPPRNHRGFSCCSCELKCLFMWLTGRGRSDTSRIATLLKDTKWLPPSALRIVSCCLWDAC